MMRRVYTSVQSRRHPSSLPRRQFSVKAIYSSFPATLHYYCPRRTSALFDHQEDDDRPDDLFHEGVTIQNGIVYPGVDPRAVLNGAVMYPNTFLMQELVRRYFDETLDREDQGKQVETPYICTISKGTPIPSHLILINDCLSRFSLQPSRGMLLGDVNRALDDFYDGHAHRETADTWLDAHPYQDAVADDADPIWMAK